MKFYVLFFFSHEKQIRVTCDQRDIVQDIVLYETRTHPSLRLFRMMEGTAVLATIQICRESASVHFSSTKYRIFNRRTERRCWKCRPSVVDK